MAIPIVVLRGDQTGQELLDQALRVLVPDVVGVDLDLVPFDLSLDSRRATRNAVVYDAVLAMTTRISRRICRVVAEFAFAHASRMHAKVFGGPTYTLSDLVLQMFGSIAGAESLVLALDDRYAVRTEFTDEVIRRTRDLAPAQEDHGQRPPY